VLKRQIHCPRYQHRTSQAIILHHTGAADADCIHRAGVKLFHKNPNHTYKVTIFRLSNFNKISNALLIPIIPLLHQNGRSACT
jgi:hypothetical protein